MRCLAEGSQQPAETSVTIAVASLAIGWLKQRLKVLRLASLDAVGLSGPLPWTKNGDLGSRRRSRKLPLSQAHSGGVGPRIGVVAPETPKLNWMRRFVVVTGHAAGNNTGVDTR